MLITAHGRAWLRARLGDAMVVGLLSVVYLLTGCDLPVSDRASERDTPAVVREPASTPMQAIPVSRDVPAAERPAPVVTGPVTFDQADQAFREKRYGDATELFGMYAEQKPDNAWGHYMLGLSAWKAGDPAVAEVAFNEALGRDPEHVKSVLGLSRVLIETGRAEEALEQIESAMLIDSSSQVFRLEGRALDELGRLDEAVDAYLEAIVRDDTDVWALNNLGFLYIRDGRESAAIGPLARAVELAPDMAVFQNNLGVALERTGFAGSAIEAFRAALNADEAYEKALINLERVEGRGIDVDVMADLTQIAAQFLDEVVSWRRLAQVPMNVESVPPDSIEQPDPEPIR
ncbi:MAG: tetratricopeptide repeat protein [Gemmatimonadota bacterium]|nr:tetratricopeptide repeat protein [Gemmatimonadota bacterium]